jgi:hypothetical protein
MVLPTCFGITLPSSGSVPSAFWDMLNWGAVDRILWMGVLCLVTWVRMNYRRISLRHNLSRKCRKIVKFVSITHSERNIWNSPIVATAISREKRKPVLKGKWGMGSTALLPLRRKACWGFFRPEKCEPLNSGTRGQQANPRPPKPLGRCVITTADTGDSPTPVHLLHMNNTFSQCSDRFSEITICVHPTSYIISKHPRWANTL